MYLPLADNSFPTCRDVVTLVFLSSAVVSASLDKWQEPFCCIRLHSHGHIQQEATESLLKEGWWLVRKLLSLFWFPVLNCSSWPFHGSSCSFDFSTPKWPVLVFHVIVGLTGVKEQGTECPWTYCTLKGLLCHHVTFID